MQASSLDKVSIMQVIVACDHELLCAHSDFRQLYQGHKDVFIPVVKLSWFPVADDYDQSCYFQCNRLRMLCDHLIWSLKCSTILVKKGA